MECTTGFDDFSVEMGDFEVTKKNEYLHFSHTPFLMQ